MSKLYQIRADFDSDSIVVYQAYNDAIADAALKHGRFAPPFSFTRMTWIKPSFLWLMHRSNWGKKSGQHRILRVRVRRSAWEAALQMAVLTSPDGPVFGNHGAWHAAFQSAKVHVQWDPERSLRGAALDHYSIQVGLSRHVIREFVEDWVVDIADISTTVSKIASRVRSGGAKKAARLLPPERPYPLPEAIGRPLLMGK